MARAPKIEPERPPHDALEGVPLPRETSILVGHGAAERVLLEAYQSARMHHAWILAGERGIGKATLALRLARFIFTHPDPSAADVAEAFDLAIAGESPVVHRVAIGAHANLLHLQRDWDDRGHRFRSELSVDSIRRITRFLGTTAGEGGWRIVIIDTADDMNFNAANALLKNLEEPPRNALFLLIASRRDSLLPTILSRCRTLHLNPLSPDDTRKVAERVAPDASGGGDFDLAASLAGGSPRRLIELQRGDGARLYRLMRRAIEAGDRQAQLELSAAATGPASDLFMDLFEDYLARRIRGLDEPSDNGDIPAPPLVTWAELWEKATRSGQEVALYNLDRRQFVLDLLETSAAAIRSSGNPKHP